MDLVKHVIKCFNKANTFTTKLPKEILDIEGYSGIKTRIFYNEICSLKFPDRPTQYLEVGAWKGSTFCSALYANPDCHGTVIENWSLFGGPKNEFEHNIKNFCNQTNVTVFEDDVFLFDVDKIKTKFDIYLYDGDHEESAHYKGIFNMWPMLADQAIIIVDDWNWQRVRKGTFDAFKDLGANIIESFEVIYTQDESHTPWGMAGREFWNGIGVFIVSKNSQ